MFQIPFISSNIDKNLARAFGARNININIATFLSASILHDLKTLTNWINIQDSIAQLNQTLSSSSKD